ncbi:MAG: hypothetical protein IKF68_02455 [Erysipelotrichaceae bacterium]|nr:hypothetical protein [Erysipelotrichaceae bacterium]
MPVKAVNFKFTEEEIKEIKETASIFNMTMTDLVKEALREYLFRLKQDPCYKLSLNVEEASAEEREEILEEIAGLKDDDLKIVRKKRCSVNEDL